MNVLDGDAFDDAFDGSRVLGDRVENPPSVNSQSQPAGGKEPTESPSLMREGKDRPAPNSKWTYAQRDQIGRLLKAGKTANQIGIELGVTRNAIIGLVSRDQELKRIGLRYRNPIAVTAKTKRQVAGGKPGKSLIAARRKVKGEHLHAAWNIARKKEGRKSDPVFVEPPIPATPVEPLMLALADLKPRSCKFIVAGLGADARFCGHESRAGGYYCQHHHRIVYTRHQDQKAT